MSRECFLSSILFSDLQVVQMAYSFVTPVCDLKESCPESVSCLVFCSLTCKLCRWLTVKILKIGTPEIITIIVLQLERLGFTVQYCVQKMQTE